MKKKISILGSTGSIGTQALEIVESLPDFFEVYALAAGNNVDSLKTQIKKFNPKVVSVKAENHISELKSEFPKIEFLAGNKGLEQIAGDRENDIVLISTTGTSGLFPTLKALENNIDVALANKETLVMAGEIVNEKLKSSKASILPVDSEHSAIHQCIKDKSQVRKLIITASGGPFRTKTLADMKNATKEQTLSHPRWNMGSKITVDSATLMNKGLEVIEAHHLFGVSYEDIEVVVHPQSVIHSAIEYKDGSVLAQLGVPSMHIPIQYAIMYPNRVEGLKTDSFSFAKTAKMEFEEPDLEKFRCLKLAFDAGKEGGIMPAVLNAANEELVYAFLDGKIRLTDIADLVEKTIQKTQNIISPSLEEIIQADKLAREEVLKLMKAVC